MATPVTPYGLTHYPSVSCLQKDELVMPLLGAMQWLDLWEPLQRASGCERFLANPPSSSSQVPRSRQDCLLATGDGRNPVEPLSSAD